MFEDKNNNVETVQQVAERLHEEVWDTLPEHEKDAVYDLALEAAQEKNVPLENPFSMEDLHNRNMIMLQGFEWYLDSDGNYYDWLAKNAREFVKMGVGGVWIPPCYKATNVHDVGYGAYDLYDLGEFNQKGTVRTKYGTKRQLKRAISALHRHNIQVYADVVLNHKAGADKTETFKAVKINPKNREIQESEPFDVEGWTCFTFPGRKGKYSDFKWNYEHFTAVDCDVKTGENGIYRIIGEHKNFSPNVSKDLGNYDYLMFADVDCRNKEVMDELIKWGEWFLKETDVDGMRMDAIKHIDSAFMGAFVRQMRLFSDKPLYFVGEYWSRDTQELADYIESTRDVLALFDVPLHFNFYKASQEGSAYDLRTILDGSLLNLDPINTATFVDNHDSQPGQSLFSFVERWFKPHAYSIILLRQDGYPCLFYGDYYGIGGENPIEGMKNELDPLLVARKHCAYGEQVDNFKSPNLIGWTRQGDSKHPASGVAVVMSNASSGALELNLGKHNANKLFFDITGNTKGSIKLNSEGVAHFPCAPGKLSVFIRQDAPVPRKFKVF